MTKVIPNGTEVLIFKHFKSYKIEQDDINFIKGIIICSKESEDLSYHGSTYNEQIYEVLGEDGKMYIGTYDSGLIGNYIFRTNEDHIKRLNKLIERNNQELLKIQNKNTEYENQINLISEHGLTSQNKVHRIKKSVNY